MANRAKTGLEYFPLEVTLFSDIKCRKMIRKYGSDAITLYLYLLCRIYEDGYYIELDEDLMFFAAETLKLDEDLVNEMLNFMLKIGIFDENLAKKEKLLTSKGIQIRYFEIAKISRRKKTVEKFSLINVQLSPINVQESSINVQDSRNIVQLSPNIVHSGRKGKERKGKERKVKERKSEKKVEMLTTQISENVFESKKNFYVCIEQISQILNNDAYWLEVSAKSNQSTIEEIQIAIPKFILHLESSGVELKSVQDAKYHFNNWFRKIRQIEQQQQPVNDSKIGRISQREITDFIRPKKTN